MKLFVVLSLASVALGGMDNEMTQKWQKLKAMESCWGEENMKLVMVDMKKAIAKCSHEDAPELSLPPYRSAYRFTNTMINKGDDYEQINDMATMFAKMMQQMKRNRNTFSPYSSMSSNSNHGDSKMETMKMMMQMMKMKNMMKNNDYSSSSYNSDNAFDMFSEMFSQEDNHRSSSDYKNPMGRMSQFKNMFNSMRFKRAAGDNLDLGDRLVEKLAEQKHQMEAKIGNMTCVMRELNVLDASNNIDVQAMKRDIQKFTMPSEWFKNKYEHLLDTCYEMATNLPAEIAENSVITGETFGTVKLGEVKMFSKCLEKAKMKLCMHQDIKTKVETNFGPMEDILQETQLTEHEFFPLVMQLLHGKEMDYMTGGM
jgi:hypothetical protein